MGRQARGEVMDPQQVQIFHCIHRCVRRAFLCGYDPQTGASYEHRRQWIRDRIEFLASIFAIECLTYTVMSNHLHQILRSRPDLVAGWSDEEVARRWLRLFPMRRDQDGAPAEPTHEEINSIVNDAEKLVERRRRLSDISWWARCTAENIAYRSNREDNVTGHFWEGRYKSQLLLDEGAVLACAAYVDLNPIRAAMAESPETCRFTGARDRIDDLRARGDRSKMSDHQWERSGGCKRSGWMSPIEIDEQSDISELDTCETGRRASEKGFLSISLRAYLELLDWTGRAILSGKRGAIPEHLDPILKRLGFSPAFWCVLVSKFRTCFKRAAGTAAHLSEEAKRRGQHWLQSPGYQN